MSAEVAGFFGHSSMLQLPHHISNRTQFTGQSSVEKPFYLQLDQCLQGTAMWASYAVPA